MGLTQTNSIDSLESLIDGEKIPAKRIPLINFYWKEVSQLYERGKILEIPPKFEKQLQTGILLTKNHGNAKQLGQAKLNLMDFFYKTDRLKETILTGTELIAEFDRYLDVSERFTLYAELSRAYYRLEYYPKYLELMPARFAAYHAKNPKANVNRIQAIEMASTYYEMKQFSVSRNYFKEALTFVKEDGKSNESSLYNNIGLTFEKEEKADSALFYYEKAYQLALVATFREDDPEFNQLYKRHFINIIKSNQAALRNNRDTLVNCLLREVETAKLVGEDVTYLKAWVKLADVYFEENEFEKCLTFLKKAEDKLSASPSDFGGLMLKVLYLKGKALSATGRVKEGNNYFQKFESLRESIESNKSKTLTEIAAIVYETNLKEQELKENEFEILEKNRSIEKKDERFFALTLFAVSLLIVVAVLYWILRALKRQRNVIERQKTALTQSLSEKETLLREVHHRVKNNLQIVSGLLEKQATFSDDAAVKSLMKDGQERIKSMAIIHENLYQTSRIEKIDVSKYFTELSQSLSDSYRNASFEVDLQLSVDLVSLHIDEAIPLGMILNELLSNAYKHAFMGLQKGVILVSLKEVASNTLELKVRDNGVGISDNFEKVSNQSLGLQLVKGFVWQLGGKLHVSDELGATFVITFNPQKTGR